MVLSHTTVCRGCPVKTRAVLTPLRVALNSTLWLWVPPRQTHILLRFWSDNEHCLAKILFIGVCTKDRRAFSCKWGRHSVDE